MNIGLRRLAGPGGAILGLTLTLALLGGVHGARAAGDFATWLEGVRREARAAGISEATLDATLSGLAPLARVIELDRRQPEFTQTFWAYLDKRIDARRIERGRALLKEHRALLRAVQARYGVQPRFLVAFWALESNFGDYTGGFSVIEALATLAFDERRGAFFRAQLMDALRIVEDGDIAPKAMQGSWAGAMGQVQFIPSTFLRHAVDFDGDGRRDLWRSLPDIFASAANYLSAVGWHGGQTWGREVHLPDHFDPGLADLNIRKFLAEWQRLGVRRIDGRDLPMADMRGAIVLPAGLAGPAFLVYGNFDAILRWNRSILYAVAVGHLADRLVGLPPLQSARPALERPLSRAQVAEMQNLLSTLGYDPGDPDGVVGGKTRNAIKAFQRGANLAADGYPTVDLLDGMRARGAAAGVGGQANKATD